MPRQRIGLTHTLATTVGQKLMVVPALALIYTGAVILALGAGLSPADTNSLSGYQTVYDRLGGLNPSDWSQAVTIAVAIAGVAGLLILLRLGWAQRLIPHVTRTAIVLHEGDDGRTTVSPRAVERAVEIAARHEGVKAAKATLGEDDVAVELHARRADQLPDILSSAKRTALTALSDAGLSSDTAVRVTVTRFTPASKKERLT